MQVLDEEDRTLPLYDLKCDTCNVINERFCHYSELAQQLCSCGGTLTQTFGKQSVILFEPRWFEHFGPEPIFVESKRHLRRLCKDFDCSSVYLMDS